LRTLSKLNEIDAAVRFTLDKLAVIKHELALLDDKWSEWNFENFLEVLGKWTINNPLPAESKFQRERREHRECMHALNSTGGGTDSRTVYVAIVRVKVIKHSAVIKLKMLERERESWLPRDCASIAQGASTGQLIVKALQEKASHISLRPTPQPSRNM
jgi:hypothetical protein